MENVALKFKSIVAQALDELKKRPFRTIVVDRTGLNRQCWSAAKIWAAAATLAQELRKIPQKRVGVVFPPCAGAWVANLAIALANKSSVNLNFVASTDSSVNSLDISGVQTVISSQIMVSKYRDFPWKKVTILDLGDYLKAEKPKIKKHFWEALFLPKAVLQKIWQLPQGAQLEDEATLLFSSGSTGKPKGIPLSNRNILTNLWQIDQIDLLPPKIRILAMLPIFHSMGFTIQYAYSIAYPVRAITYPSPLESAALGQIARQEKVKIIIGTASLYRLYMRSISAKDFRSVESVVAGAEKTPKGLPEAWEEKFGSRYYEGYGLTETSPVIAVCLKHAYRHRSVGLPLPCLETRIVHPETKEVLTTPGQQGVLEVRGPSIFKGYLNEPKLNKEVIRDGWFFTGDLASIDADGFLFIEGRLRRFSKIAGEMVPHAAVEEAMVKALGWTQEQAAGMVVTGVPDDKKGESLVVISEHEIDLDTVRAPMQQMGFPNLWIPKKLIKIDHIPHLPSGKLDLHGVTEIAKHNA